MANIILKLVTEDDFNEWLDQHKRQTILSSSDVISMKRKARYFDIEAVPDTADLLHYVAVTLDEDLQLRDALANIIQEFLPTNPPWPTIDQGHRRDLNLLLAFFVGLAIICWIYGLAFNSSEAQIAGIGLFVSFLFMYIMMRIFAYFSRSPHPGYQFRFPSIENTWNYGGSKKTLRSLGFENGDIIVIQREKPVPGAMGFWGEIFRDQRFWSEEFYDFLSQAIVEKRGYYRPSIMDSKENPKPPCVGGVVLYTEEDWAVASYIRQHFATLHIMSGLFLTLYVLEDKPTTTGDLVRNTRAFWSERLRPAFYRVWCTLGLAMSKPHPGEAVYHFCNKISISPDSLPCVILFRDWRKVRTEREIIPIDGELSIFFRSLCGDVKRCIEEIAPENGFPELLKKRDNSFMNLFSNRWRGRVSMPKRNLKKNRKKYNTRVPTVFLCHSSNDKPFVERLARDLRSLGMAVWFDKWEINVGDSIISKIQDGIEKNDYLAIVLSPDSVESPWVQRELNAALMRELSEKRVVVLPILHKSCKVPIFIREKLYADFTRNYTTGMETLLKRLNIDV